MMQLPNVLNVLNDTAKQVRYEVIAYRSLNEQELVQAVRVYLSMAKKKPKKNSMVQIHTIIGGDDRLEW